MCAMSRWPRCRRCSVATRPTAVNLHWALARMRGALAGLQPEARAAAAYAEAAAICDEDVALCRAIGEHGLPLIREVRGWPDGEVTPDGWAATWYDLQELEAHDWLGGAWTQPVDVYTRDGWGKQPLHERTGHFRAGLAALRAWVGAQPARLLMAFD